MAVYFLRVCAAATLFSAAVGNVRSFRGSEAANRDFEAEGRVDSLEVRAKLNEALDSILSVGSASNQRDRTQRVEKLMHPSFEAMPKTSPGRLGPQAVRHVLRNYFSKQHGWNIFGLDKDPSNVSAGSKEMLQHKVPGLMESVLEAREHGQGLNLPEVVAVATALERLILDESVRLLHLSYDMNGYDDAANLNATEVQEVLFTYLAIFKIRNNNNITANPTGHHRWKKNMKNQGKWHEERLFAMDSFFNYEFAQEGQVHRFSQRQYSFETVAQIVDSMADHFGRWQDGSCKVLKNRLEMSDTAGNGRVSLEDFYNTKDLPIFVLNEPVEKLRALGVLDETVPSKPTVRLANYITSTGNCGHFSEYYDVCCFNVCDSIMEDLELRFKSSSVEVGKLYGALVNLTAPPDVELNIASSPLFGAAEPRLLKSLEAIADRYGGKVPIQGRNFATWLHFAFPRDCPLPTKIEATAAEMPADAMKEVAPQEWASDMDFHMPETSEWATEDSIALLEDMQISEGKQQSGMVRSAVRVLAMLSACAAVVHTGMQHCGSIAGALHVGVGSRKKNDDFQLPLRF